MELERKSSGVAKGGLATGIVGTSLGALNSMALLGAGVTGLGGLMNRNACGTQPVVVMDNGWGWNNGFRDGCVCSEDRHVNRYELELQQKIAEKDSQIALRDANTYNDQKTLEMYKYVDGRFNNIEAELARQAVINQKTEDSFLLAKQDLECCCNRLEDRICCESRERRCADNQIINYTNATFYPKQVANVTTGTTTTAQTLYNPLPQNNNCCGCCNN